MIHVLAVIAGLAAGFIRAKIGKRAYQPENLKAIWLVLVAVIPQWLAFSFSPTRSAFPDWVASSALVLSQAILLLFAVLNWKSAGFWLLGLGLVMNLLVIVTNGGFMPISPETVSWLTPGIPSSLWSVGERFAGGKDIVLPVESTLFYFLSDHFRSPDFDLFRVAFSLGDIFIAIGAFWLLWAIGGEKRGLRAQENSNGSNGV
mgnify:FL=1